MVTAIVLITCEVDRTSETAETLADLDGISEVYSVAGDWDLAAIDLDSMFSVGFEAGGQPD